MSNYQHLDWDTNIFGFKVARILPATLTSAELEKSLHELKSQDVKLVFWPSDSTDEASQIAAKKCAGFLADYKVTYVMPIGKDFVIKQPSNLLEEYNAATPTHELELLALEIGYRSRFGTDPKIPRDILTQVYKTWIANCVKKQVAEKVLVTYRDNKVVGMVTLSEKSGRGDIGLIAVLPDYRGLGIAKDLVHAAQAWCKEKGLAECQVVTQQTNHEACKLYESTGFSLEKLEHFYDFWL